MINTKILLFLSIIVIFLVYSFLFPLNKIINIVLDEYIMIGLNIVAILIYYFFKMKLKRKVVYEFIPNTNYIPIKSTLLFFAFFQVIDYTFEGGLIPMIRLWFMYWIFGLFAYYLTHIINYYKNYQAYKKQGLL